ncbi:AMP-binding protein [Prosthecobacter sp.]|uniref:AMP-binding protein n=1 Tax=Prosthecobacter sp. TaxID=1965333 RepID=UPI00378468EC
MLRETLTKNFCEHAELSALSFAEGEMSYLQAMEAASSLMAEGMRDLPAGPVGIFGGREPAMYLGLLSAVLSGRAYVPLNVKFPPARLAEMISVAGCSCVIYDPRHEALLHGVLREAGLQISEKTEAKLPHGAAVAVCNLAADAAHAEAGAAHEGFAYVLFTSGSTGKPKGIGITRENLLAYLQHATKAFGLRPGERASQMFELTFDLSVHDLFVTWLCGGCVCVPAAADMMAPARFILNQRITHWFSVPSTAALLSRLRLLRANVFPGLRQSLFCGEALPAALAVQWQAAAPASALWNLYGPTEATIAITAHEFTEPGRECAGRDVVPIGVVFPGHLSAIVKDGVQAGAGEAGELWVSGPQVSRGYLANAAQTAEMFVTLKDWPDERVWYRTGDLVRADEAKVMHYLGRLDSQIQVHGHRVELGEVESALRKVCGGRAVAALGWPRNGSMVEGIAGFVEGTGTQEDVLKMTEELTAMLPAYMVPTRLQFVASMPLNSNGKTDRNTLAKQLPSP